RGRLLRRGLLGGGGLRRRLRGRRLRGRRLLGGRGLLRGRLLGGGLLRRGLLGRRADGLLGRSRLLGGAVGGRVGGGLPLRIPGGRPGLRLRGRLVRRGRRDDHDGRLLGRGGRGRLAHGAAARTGRGGGLGRRLLRLLRLLGLRLGRRGGGRRGRLRDRHHGGLSTRRGPGRRGHLAGGPAPGTALRRGLLGGRGLRLGLLLGGRLDDRVLGGGRCGVRLGGRLQLHRALGHLLRRHVLSRRHLGVRRLGGRLAPGLLVLRRSHRGRGPPARPAAAPTTGRRGLRLGGAAVQLLVGLEVGRGQRDRRGGLRRHLGLGLALRLLLRVRRGRDGGRLVLVGVVGTGARLLAPLAAAPVGGRLVQVHDDAAPVAVDAGLGERLQQALADPLAGHLDQAQRRHLGHLVLRAVPAQALQQAPQHQIP